MQSNSFLIEGCLTACVLLSICVLCEAPANFAGCTHLSNTHQHTAHACAQHQQGDSNAIPWVCSTAYAQVTVVL